MSYELPSRVGRFKVDAFFFFRRAPEEGLNLFDRMVVLDIRHDYLTGMREYVATHPDFEPRVEGALVPEYKAVFSTESSIPKWVKCEPEPAA